ncbi:hydrolase [Halobellus salinus]|uniref:Hydrolase n=2 Tax=Halobellus salinus TaxID=931585 RepID=A0A830EPV3_9EURY|nr:hydrolase [Halobellus salinus]SMP24843.1 putative hydrolase of the HAD superfamily [Halobellus salinus]
MTFDSVVFDLDNTLCRRTGDVDAAYRRAFDRVGADPFGAPEKLWAALDGPPDPGDRTGYLGAGFARVAARHGRSDVDPIAVAAALLDEIDNAEVELLPGAERALDAARALGPIGILTNGPERRQRVKIEALGLEPTVDAIVYAGDLPRRKPHVDPFEAILTDLEVAADRTLYVGDSLAYDVAGAHNAGLGAAWLRQDDDNGGYDPDYVLDSLIDLTDVLAE